MKIAGISSNKLGADLYEGNLENQNLYNDKELLDDGDLDWHEYGFRNYDAQIGRFPQVDPLVWSTPEFGGYQYAINEPIANIDVDGLFGGEVVTIGGVIHGAVGPTGQLLGGLGKSLAQGLASLGKGIAAFGSSSLRLAISIGASSLNIGLKVYNKGVADDDMNWRLDDNNEDWSLSFHGDASPKNKNEPQMGSGLLDIINKKTKKTIASFTAISGNGGNGLLPDGTWEAYKPTPDNGWTDETETDGWKMRVEPTGKNLIGWNRNLIRIHPTKYYWSKSVNGVKIYETVPTDGCIGIVHHDNVIKFKSLMDSYFQNSKHKKIELNVSITGNNNVNDQRFIKKK